MTRSTGGGLVVSRPRYRHGLEHSSALLTSAAADTGVFDTDVSPRRCHDAALLHCVVEHRGPDRRTFRRRWSWTGVALSRLLGRGCPSSRGRLLASLACARMKTVAGVFRVTRDERPGPKRPPSLVERCHEGVVFTALQPFFTDGRLLASVTFTSNARHLEGGVHVDTRRSTFTRTKSVAATFRRRWFRGRRAARNRRRRPSPSLPMGDRSRGVGRRRFRRWASRNALVHDGDVFARVVRRWERAVQPRWSCGRRPCGPSCCSHPLA